jgi:hypothetical protein
VSAGAFADDPAMRSVLRGLLRSTAGACFDATGTPVPCLFGVL